MNDTQKNTDNDTKYTDDDIDDFDDFDDFDDINNEDNNEDTTIADIADIEKKSKNDINHNDDGMEYNYINQNSYNFMNLKQYRFRPDLHQHPIEYTDLESRFSENFADYDEEDLYF